MIHTSLKMSDSLEHGLPEVAGAKLSSPHPSCFFNTFLLKYPYCEVAPALQRQGVAESFVGSSHRQIGGHVTNQCSGTRQTGSCHLFSLPAADHHHHLNVVPQGPLYPLEGAFHGDQWEG